MNNIVNNSENINNFGKYFYDLLVLAGPLLIGNLGHTLIGATDVFVVAKYNIDSLAAVSIANSILFTISIFGIGLITAISIVLSNMRGSGENTKKYLFSSLLFSLVLSVLFSIICYSTKYLIPYCGFEEKIIPDIIKYIEIVSFSMFGVFIFEGIKQYLQSFEIVKFPNILLLFTVIVNLICDYIFVFGFGFIPEMGTKGAAIATLSVRTFMGLVMFIYILKSIDFKESKYFNFMKKLFKIGIPIGAALLLEFLAFNIITILVGREASILSAVHNILITISSATFMLPLSIATALSVKVAYYYGANKKLQIKKFSIAAIVLGVGFMILAGICLAVFPRQVIRLFTDNKEVLKIALPLISIVAMYQIFDGFQTVMGGILKGFKMTKAVSYTVLFGYWGAGMPVAVFLVGMHNFSLRGYWIALAVSLCTIGFLQASIARHKYNKMI